TRTAIALLTCALFIIPQTGLAVFRTQRLRHHVLRSVSQGCSQTFLLIAFSLMPLAGAIAINFSSPLFATLISALVLKEAVGLARWLALLVGFCGVLIVANPDAGTFQIGALFALANAVLYGSVTVGVRGMTATESAETLILYQLALLTAFFALFRRFQCRGTILVDARAPTCPGLRRGPVQLSLAGVGEHLGIRDLGGRADSRAGDRFGGRGRLQSVPIRAREHRSAGKAARHRVKVPDLTRGLLFFPALQS